MIRAQRAIGLLTVAALALGALACGGSEPEPTRRTYTLNGDRIGDEHAQMLAAAGLPPGDYWIDAAGQLLREGEDEPVFPGASDDFEGFEAFADEDLEDPDDWTRLRPGALSRTAPEAEPGLDAGGLAGTRVFWIQTSILSNSGASGYVHFCPGGLFYTSSEASFSVQGGGARAGGAATSNAAGSWRLTRESGEPWVAMRFNDGSSGGYRVSDLSGGRAWRVGQYKYAAEPGRASCD